MRTQTDKAEGAALVAAGAVLGPAAVENDFLAGGGD